MQLRKLMLFALGAAAAAAVSVGCSDVSLYKIDAPDDLQARIDEIAERNKPVETDGKTSVVVTKFEIGVSDYSTGWWGDHSQSFEVAPGKLLHIEFDNYGARVNNWSNWNLALVTVGGGAHSADDDASYAEYFVMRSDLYGWGNGDYDGGLISSDYAEVIGEVDDMWAVFRDLMYGAHVTIELDHSSTGYTYMTATATSADGAYTITETYNHPTPSTASVYAFLITDNSYMVMDADHCWTEDSKVTAIVDYDAESISVTGTPVSIELGSEDFWGNGVATVTFADGSSTVVDREDIEFVAPDVTTVGTKTVVYSYSKTKLGNYGRSVAGYYTIEVTNPIVAIEAEANAYLIGGAKRIALSKQAVKVTGTYADGTTAVLNGGQFEIAFTNDQVVYDGVPGTYEDAFTVTYTSASGEAITASGDLVIAESPLPAQTEPVGAPDFTNGWWLTFSQDWKVAPYESQTVSLTLSSDNLGNWHSPCTILRKADLSEYLVVRQDHYGWGGSYDACDKASNWNWDTFAGALNGSKIAITVANGGDGFASVRYTVTDANGEEHFQYYDHIAVDSGDLQFALVCEESYLVFD